MKQRFRLRKQTDFERVRRHGKSYAHPLIVLVALPNEQGHARFGVSAGRSLGNAVQRNRAKRQIRAAIHPLISRVSPGWDIIILARRPLARATFQQLETALQALFRRAKLFA